jgi:hypothetical protein
MFVRCPHCNRGHWRDCLDSVTIEASYTDGRDICTYHQDVPFFKCTRCQNIREWSELEQQIEKARPRFLEKLLARNAAPVTVSDMLSALDTLPDSERELRLEAWRLANDPHRKHRDDQKPLPSSRPPWWHENMAALLTIVNRPITLAEIYRELGQFDCTLQVTTSEEDDESDLKLIHRLAEQANAHVQSRSTRR